MGTRVRKLARELRRTPAEVLGLLHDLGYLRYQSSEDMVADVAVQRLRKAARDAPRRLPTSAPGPRPPVPKPQRPRAPEPATDDLMAQLVPGVVRTQKKEAHQPTRRKKAAKGEGGPRPPSAPATAVQAQEAPPPVTPGEPEARLEVERARLEADRARLEVERTAVERLRAELEALRVDLQEARAELAAARDEVEETRAQVQAERAAQASRGPDGVALVDVFEARGLRGADELQRALASLAEGRHLGPLLAELRVAEERRLARILEDRLVLVGGEVPEALKGGAAVTVAPERADVPDARELGRLLDEVGEQLLLNGLRQAVVIGASPRWHRLIREGIDRRIDVQFRARPDQDGLVPGRGDAVLCWRVVLPDAQRQDWAMRQAVVIEVPEPGLEPFLVAVRDRLRGG